MNTYAVIMAGGGGTRFWPSSRQKTPKQLLNLTGNDYMINETIQRILPVIPADHIFIVTNQTQVESMRKITAGYIQPHHILSEPAARNTAACIGYAAFEITKKYGEGIMCVFPADHYIKDKTAFAAIIKESVNTAANHDKLVTIGIPPTFPSTGYGYIKFSNESKSNMKEVQEFKEKPDLETAAKYIRNGNYLWNSGMFIWKTSTILNAFERYLPKIYSCLTEIAAAMNTENEQKKISEIYPSIPSISIDYGIMERSGDVVVLPGDFGWNDVGSWETMDALHESDQQGNVCIGDSLVIDTANCVTYSRKRLIAAVGVENLIIVESDDAILVCDKDRAQDVKLVVDQLAAQGREDLL